MSQAHPGEHKSHQESRESCKAQAEQAVPALGRFTLPKAEQAAAALCVQDSLGNTGGEKSNS